MFVLPKGTLVKFHGMPFRLLEDVPTDGLAENYQLALAEQASPKAGAPAMHPAITGERSRPCEFDGTR